MNLLDLRPVEIATKKQAEAICGTLSKPSKMPCHGFSTPADACQVGSQLRKIPGSVCAGCYALKGRYRFPNVQRAMEFRLGNLVAACPVLAPHAGEKNGRRLRAINWSSSPEPRCPNFRGNGWRGSASWSARFYGPSTRRGAARPVDLPRSSPGQPVWRMPRVLGCRCPYRFLPGALT